MNRLLIVAALAALSSAATAQSAPVTLTEYRIIMKDTITGGRVSFQISNQGVASHALHIKAVDTTIKVDRESTQINKGQVGVLTVTLPPGKYQLWCPLAEETHKNAGMAKTITVVAPKPPPPKSKPK